jgi:phosphoribosylanthranilate isomerase
VCVCVCVSEGCSLAFYEVALSRRSVRVIQLHQFHQEAVEKAHEKKLNVAKILERTKKIKSLLGE